MFRITAVSKLRFGITIISIMTITIMMLSITKLGVTTHSVNIMSHTKQHPGLQCSE